MNRLLISKDLPLAQNGEIGTLQKGQIGVFGINKLTGVWEACTTGIFGVGTGTFGRKDYSMIQVFLGGSNSPSDVFKDLQMLQMTKIPYKKGVAQVDRVSFSGVGSSPFDEFEIKISLINTLSVEFQAEVYVTNGGKATVRAIYDELANQINCSKRSQFFAKGTDAGVEVTPRNPEYQFEMAGKFVKDVNDTCHDCACIKVQKDHLVSYNAASGNGLHLKRMDYDFLPDKGQYSDLRDRLIPIPALYGDAGEDIENDKFDLYQIVYQNGQNDTGWQAKAVFEVTQTLVVAFPSGGTSDAGAEFETIMEGLTGKTFALPIAD